MKSIRIVIVDDHSVVRSGLALMINAQQDMVVVGEASEGREAIQQVYKLHPDLLLLDLSMPDGLDGIETTKEIKQIFPQTKIIVLTMYEEDAYLWRVLRLGVEGYLLKITTDLKLINTIRRVYHGEEVYETHLAQELVDDMKKKRYASSEYEILTDREREILILTAKGFKNKEIATTLNISVKTVENHKLNMMRKLNINSTRNLIDYATRNHLLDLYR